MNLVRNKICEINDDKKLKEKKGIYNDSDKNQLENRIMTNNNNNLLNAYNLLVF